jgi:purine-binding chemotaxis protein CheW
VAQKIKNVVVFTTGGTPYAVELGWIREVFTLGHVTPVPHSNSAIAGVVNFRGSIVPVLDIRNEPEQQGSASAGDSALLLEVDRCKAALRAGVIDEVASLKGDDVLIDSRGRKVQLLPPQPLFSQLREGGLES